MASAQTKRHSKQKMASSLASKLVEVTSKYPILEKDLLTLLWILNRELKTIRFNPEWVKLATISDRYVITIQYARSEEKLSAKMSKQIASKQNCKQKIKASK